MTSLQPAPLRHVDDLRRDPARALVMGILNVTPDSFASAPLVGEAGPDIEAAVALARRMWTEGADLIDVGGESTRPQATRVDEDEELARVVPVVEALTARGIATSVDTMRASVAEAAVRAGARMVNDVSGGLADGAMLATVASLGCAYVAMHWRGHSEDMYAQARYSDVAAEVADELSQRAAACSAAGIAESLLVLDPGIGFQKLPEHNWDLLRRLGTVQALGYPVLVGVSRKRFLGEVLADGVRPRDPEGRDVATAALSALMAARGAWGVRVHDVRSNVDAVTVAAAMKAPGTRAAR